jgi:hypothetical protein
MPVGETTAGYSQLSPQPALRIIRQRRDLPGQFRLVPPELFRVMPPGWIEAPDLIGQVEQPPRPTASDPASGRYPGHQAIGHAGTGFIW